MLMIFLSSNRADDGEYYVTSWDGIKAVGIVFWIPLSLFFIVKFIFRKIDKLFYLPKPAIQVQPDDHIMKLAKKEVNELLGNNE